MAGWRSKAFGEMNPRMILMDVSMPEMNGLEATAAIREPRSGTGRHVPIIGVTAHALKGDRERCLEAGMDDYLPKPISPKALLDKVERWSPGVERRERLSRDHRRDGDHTPVMCGKLPADLISRRSIRCCLSRSARCAVGDAADIKLSCNCYTRRL